MQNLYEVISYDNTNYKFSLGRETYFVPHFHREIEFGIVLEGSQHILTSGKDYVVNPGEFWILNSCQCHEVFSPGPDQPYVFLELQISPSFFKQYFPKIDRLRIETVVLNSEMLGTENYQRLLKLLMESARCYFESEPYYELKCAGDINYLLRALLHSVPSVLLTEDELRISNSHLKRMQRITDYIEEHYGEKLLLSELAEREGLTLNYLSHFFKDCFGMPFQSYLQRIRCQKAGALLLETDYSLSDISLICGFSALKYMNSGFKNLFGYSPKEYRLHFQSDASCCPDNEKKKIRQPLSLSSDRQNSPDGKNRTYHFFSHQECIRYLEKQETFKF